MNAEQEGRGMVIPEAIRSLLEQRAQYMAWLARLDDLGGQYRHEVASRVRADYSDRLTGVEDQLLGHRAELESSLSERQSRLAELEERHELCAAELEEVELRHQVGEFDADEWERRKAEHGEELEAVGEELGQEREAVAELGAVLVQVTAPAEAASTKHVETIRRASTRSRRCSRRKATKRARRTSPTGEAGADPFPPGPTPDTRARPGETACAR
ncbi:MAG: hypothetical protein P8049_07975 [Gemmatimonadota bacterium]